jgi:hypothetical protein
MHPAVALLRQFPEMELILSVQEKPAKVVVITQMAHNFKFTFKYELVKYGGRWLIKDNCLST